MQCMQIVYGLICTSHITDKAVIASYPPDGRKTEGSVRRIALVIKINIGSFLQHLGTNNNE